MSNGKDWIDFNLVKQSVSMELLIVHLGLFKIARKGDEVRLKCPFHNGKSDNSMAINLSTNTFYCFGCKAGGGVIEFVAKYEDCPPRTAAVKLDEWFEIVNGKSSINSEREVVKTFTNGTELVPPITAQHLIASIELQLAQLKKLIFSR